MGRYKWGFFKGISGVQGLGFRVDISGVIIRATTVITHIRGRLTTLITAHEPASSDRV